MTKRGAIKTDLFSDQHHKETLDKLGDPLRAIEACIDFAVLAEEVDRIAPRHVSPQGGRPPFPTETMVRILVLKRLYNLSDEQMECPLLDRMSYKRFCGLTHASNIPDRTTVWVFENRIGEAGAKALFDGVSTQLLKKGFIARGGQIIDATLVPAPRQQFTRDDKEQIKAGGHARRLVARQAAPERPGCDLDQEAWQEPPWLQALGERRQAAQVHPQDRHRHR